MGYPIDYISCVCENIKLIVPHGVSQMGYPNRPPPGSHRGTHRNIPAPSAFVPQSNLQLTRMFRLHAWGWHVSSLQVCKNHGYHRVIEARHVTEFLARVERQNNWNVDVIITRLLKSSRAVNSSSSKDV